MKRSCCLVLAYLLVVAGCSLKAKWRDTTGQDRSRTQEASDEAACDETAGMKALNKDSAVAEMDAAVAKLKLCMADRGWALVRADAKDAS